MATQIKNTLSFDLAPGAEVTLTHELNNGTIPVSPDIIFIPSADLEVSAVTTASLTLTNKGGTQLTGAVLVEWWHTIERAFGDVANEDLPVKPYIVVGAETANEPPQPPFHDPPLVLTIYARLTGNDLTGEGTLLNPYRTFQRAVRDVPGFIPPGVRYVIDISNLGVETLPDDYVLPSWKSSYNATGYNHDDPYYYTIGAVSIRAYPQLAASLPSADQIIGVGATVAPRDPVTSLVEITDLTKNWPVNGLVGMFIVGDITPGVPFSNFSKAPVISNTATTVVVSIQTFPFSITLPARVMEISATLEGKNAIPSYGNGAIGMAAQDSLVLQGIRIRPTDVFSLGGRWSGGSGSGELCHIVAFVIGSFSGDFEFVSSIIDNTFLNGNVGALFSRYVNESKFGSFCYSMSAAGGASFEGVTLTAQYFMFVDGALIEDAPKDGVYAPAVGLLFNAEINDSVENAVSNDKLNMFLLNVVGTGNGGFGNLVINGGLTTIDAATTVTGAGGDQQVGDQAIPNVYPAAGNQIADPAPAGVSPIGAGTFSRLVVNP